MTGTSNSQVLYILSRTDLDGKVAQVQCLLFVHFIGTEIINKSPVSNIAAGL
jgi:ribosomal protein S28E/S33